MKSILFILSLFICITACKQDSAAKATEVVTNTASQEILAPLSVDEIKNLYAVADYIDYIFFDWSFSMNQSEPNAVKAAITFISGISPETIPSNCKAVGRLVFQTKGEIIKEADLNYSEGCYYYTFVNDQNRPVHHNAMTDQGISFYQKMFAQAMQPIQQGQ